MARPCTCVTCADPWKAWGRRSCLLTRLIWRPKNPAAELVVLRSGPGQRRILLGLDRTGGGERLTLRICDIATARDLSPPLEGLSAGGLAWGAEDDTVFVVELDDTGRPWRVLRLELLSGALVEIHRAETPEGRLRLRRGEAGRHLLLSESTHGADIVWALDLGDGGAVPRRVADSAPGGRVFAAEAAAAFYLLRLGDCGASAVHRQNFDAPPGCDVLVYAAPRESPITALQAFRDHLLLCQRIDGLPRLRLLGLADGSLQEVALPPGTLNADPGDNRDFDTDALRFGADGPAMPYIYAAHDLATCLTHVLSRQEVTENDLARVAVRRRHAVSGAASVPATLILPADRRGPVPVLCTAYGAYGYALEDRFSVLPLVLAAHGVGHATCHVRGGGEFGLSWWKAGAGRAKGVGVADLIAAVETCIAAGDADPAGIDVMGESAGAFLVAAALNRRPELFRAAILDCPFLDPIAILGDPNRPFTRSEWSEWGDPANPDDLASLLDVSPYAGIKPARYPDALIYVSANDVRSPPWEALKCAARLRATRTGTGAVILRRRADAGHAGAAEVHADLREWAEKLAFAIAVLSTCSASRHASIKAGSRFCQAESISLRREYRQATQIRSAFFWSAV